MGKYKRSTFFNVNRFQQKILYPVLLTAFAAFNLILLCMAYFYYPNQKVLFYGMHLNDLRIVVIWLLLFVSFLLVFIVFWTLYMSNKVVGPYERVVRELKAIADGEKNGPIGTRPGDEMYAEILKHVNVIIEKMAK